MQATAAQVRQAPAAQSAVLNILYGSQTGNGEAVAESLAESVRAAGGTAKLRSFVDIRPAALKKMDYVAIVISTHGEGDPPDDALELFEWLKNARSAGLGTLQYRILALGDSSYEEFCAAGRQLDAMLRAGGARPFGDMLECDVDYHVKASKWSSEVLDWSREKLGSAAANEPLGDPADPGASRAVLTAVPTSPAWKRARPFPGVVERVQKITGLGSPKDVYHVEISLEGSGLAYQPGDSLGVWAYNDAELVSRVLKRLNIAPATLVDDEERVRSIRDTLTRHREITRLHHDVVECYGEIEQASGKGKLLRRWGQLDAHGRKEFMEARQFIDLVESCPAAIEAQQLADLLPKLAPRSYSIASSRAAVDDEVHLTVATLRSNAIGAEREGVASRFLNYRLQQGDEVGVFLEPNTRFRVPEEDSAPLIMIGAGTGIAPYRAFMQELEETGRSPGAWLIFGNPHQRTDFLYQRDWLRWRQQGLLTRIDVAFSRDQAAKRYVQDVVADNGAAFDEWLRRGAHIYICGAIAMGEAVERNIIAAIAAARDLGPEAAHDFLHELRRERRLHKDLY